MKKTFFAFILITAVIMSSCSTPQNEILLLNKNINTIIGMKPEKLVEQFGLYDERLKGEHYFDSICYGGTSDGEKDCGWIVFQADEVNGESQVLGIISDPNNLTINGRSLFDTEENLKTILGNDYEIAERTRYSRTYMWKWNDGENELFFTFSDDPYEETPYLVCVH